MKTMGILGTGRRALWFAKAFADAGVRVVLGSRHVGRARWVAERLGRKGITPGSYGEAIAAPFVLPAMPSHDQILATLEPLRDALAGRIYIDVTNRLDADYSTFVLPPEMSFAEYVQERFPEVQVVGAFKHTWWELLDVLGNNGMYLDVYIVGDDDTAKRELRSMCSAMPFRFRDAGRLREARFIEHMTLLSGALGPL